MTWREVHCKWDVYKSNGLVTCACLLNNFLHNFFSGKNVNFHKLLKFLENSGEFDFSIKIQTREMALVWWMTSFVIFYKFYKSRSKVRWKKKFLECSWKTCTFFLCVTLLCSLWHSEQQQMRKCDETFVFISGPIASSIWKQILRHIDHVIKTHFWGTK